MEFNREQLKVINARGNMLVSASAGSGKTTVMIERIASLIVKDRVPLEKMLICTFTRAAAADMKQKLYKRLGEQIEKGYDAFLEEQILYMPKAEICTIDSWCQRIVKNYFYVLDIDPEFEICDENENALISGKILDGIIGDRIREGKPEFVFLYDALKVRRDDAVFRGYVNKIYNFADTQPDPMQWLQKEALKSYSKDKYAAEYIKGERERFVKAEELRLKNVYDRFNSVGFTRDLKVINGLIDFINGGEPVKAAAGKIPPEFKSEHDEFMSLKKAIEERFKTFCRYEELPKSAKAKKYAEVLVNCAAELYQKAEEYKTKKSRFNYADIEHTALRLLSDKDVNAAVKSKYLYVFVDEYQDTNPLQEALLSKIKGESNMFYVGDVKQSIYSFRLCEPKFFIDKFRNYADYGFNPPASINHNYRSKKEILKFCNKIFKKCMTKEFGQVDYGAEAEFKSGLKESGGEIKIKLIKNAPPKSAEGVYCITNETVSAAVPADLIAADIVKKLSSADKNGEPIKEGDIAVLSRNSGEGEEVGKRLKNLGVNVNIGRKIAFSDIYETDILCKFIELIDNNTDEIALTALLKSYFVGLTDDELADVRLSENKRDVSFNSAARSYAKTGNAAAVKLKAFFEELDLYVKLSVSLPLYELIGRFTAAHDYFHYVLSRPDGQSAAAAVNAFLNHLSTASYAVTPAEYSRFLKNGGASFEINSDPSSVSIMTIHSSKGLEFKYVYFISVDKKINDADWTDKLIIDQELGAVMKTYDAEKLEVTENIVYAAAAMKTRRSKLEEEMRLLYVALTRAKEGLYIYTKGNRDKKNSFWADDVISHWDWIKPVIAQAQCEEADLAEITPLETEQCLKNVKFIKKVSPLSKKIAARIKTPLKSPMPYKTSVTEIADAETPVDYKDDRAAERGKAFHKAMEIMDFSKPFADEIRKIGREVPEIRSYKDSTGKLYNAYNTIKPMVEGREFYREKAFIYKKEDGRLVQGVIDLMILEKGEATVIDYKTSPAQYIDSGSFKKQLQEYATAVKSILKIKVKRAAVYSFELGAFKNL